MLLENNPCVLSTRTRCSPGQSRKRRQPTALSSRSAHSFQTIIDHFTVLFDLLGIFGFFPGFILFGDLGTFDTVLRQGEKQYQCRMVVVLIQRN